MNPMCQMSFSARIVRTFVLNTRHQFIKGSDSGNWTLTDEYNSEITSYSRHHQTTATASSGERRLNLNKQFTNLNKNINYRN